MLDNTHLSNPIETKGDLNVAQGFPLASAVVANAAQQREMLALLMDMEGQCSNTWGLLLCTKLLCRFTPVLQLLL